jgi:hypothetical protein
MIIAVIGLRWKVAGIRMAMVAVGPIPGSTPMRVPRKTPLQFISKIFDPRIGTFPKTIYL